MTTNYPSLFHRSDFPARLYSCLVWRKALPLPVSPYLDYTPGCKLLAQTETQNAKHNNDMCISVLGMPDLSRQVRYNSVRLELRRSQDMFLRWPKGIMTIQYNTLLTLPKGAFQ